jgi:adenosylmethionine-8-amino-7-oxononanoate aminotransferase
VWVCEDKRRAWARSELGDAAANVGGTRAVTFCDEISFVRHTSSTGKNTHTHTHTHTHTRTGNRLAIAVAVVDVDARATSRSDIARRRRRLNKAMRQRLSNEVQTTNQQTMRGGKNVERRTFGGVTTAPDGGPESQLSGRRYESHSDLCER